MAPNILRVIKVNILSKIFAKSIYIHCTSRLHPGRGAQVCYDQSARGGSSSSSSSLSSSSTSSSSSSSTSSASSSSSSPLSTSLSTSSTLSLEVAFGEIDDMIRTVDRNKDGKISYSEFRVRRSIKVAIVGKKNQQP